MRSTALTANLFFSHRPVLAVLAALLMGNTAWAAQPAASAWDRLDIKNKAHYAHLQLQQACECEEILTASALSASNTVLAPAEMAAIADFSAWVSAFMASGTATVPGVDLDRGEALALQRRAVMAELIRSRPAAALKHAVPQRISEGLPANIRRHLEAWVEGCGEFRVAIAESLAGPRSMRVTGIRREVEIAGRAYAAHVYGTWAQQQSQSDVLLRGVVLDQAIALQDQVPLVALDSVAAITARQTLDGNPPTAGSESVAAAVSSPSRTAKRSFTQGIKRILFMPVAFSDDLTVPITAAAAYQLMNQVNQFYVDETYNSVSLITDVTPLIVLPKTKATYTAGSAFTLWADARVVAQSLGFDPASYDFDITAHPILGGANFNYAGNANIGGKGLDLQVQTVSVTAHELGHNFGLNHANFWSAPNDSVIGPGSAVEYGNIFDIMGNDTSTPLIAQFSTSSKNEMDWLPTSFVHTVTNSGTFRVFAYDVPNLVGDQKYALKIKKDFARNYWGEFRQRFVNNRWSQNGLVLSWSPFATFVGNSLSGATLLDTTPGTPASNSSRDDAPVVIGRTFSDPTAGIHITPMGKGNTGGENWIDVRVNVGAFAGNNGPDLTIASSETFVAPNATVNFTAFANDPDGDALAFYWDFADQTFGTNGPTASKSWSSAGQYVVRCVASDMKGGVASRFIVVTVGSPAVFQVSGNILGPNSQPLEGVRVNNGLTGSSYRGTYTDSSGNFTLANLAGGAYTISAVKYGYTMPTTPLTVSADVTGVNLTGTQLPTLTVVALNPNAGEGAGTGTFRILRTGSLSSSLPLRFGMSGGATFSTDYSLSPNPTVSTSLQLTMAAGAASMDITLSPVIDTTAEGPEAATLTLFETTAYLLGNSNEATVIIADGQPETKPTVTVQAKDDLATESGGDAGTFLFSRTGFSASDLVVRYSVGGTATPGSDYPAIGSTAVIPAGQSSVEVHIRAVDEGVVEPNETVVATLTADTAYTIGTPAAATINIINDDLPMLTVALTRDNAVENSGNTNVFTISRVGDLEQSLTVFYSFSGTASQGVDYTAPAGSITIAAGLAATNINVIPINDALIEGPETVTFSLVSDPRYNIGTPSTATATIVDDDSPSVTLTATDSSATEAAGNTGAFTFARSGSTAQALPVYFNIAGTAVKGADYATIASPVIIPAGASSVVLTISPIDDPIKESTETVVLSLQPDPVGVYTVGTTAQRTVSITDNDSGGQVGIGFLTSSGSGLESSFLGTITVALTASSSSTVTVQMDVSGGTATLGSDFNANATRTVTFSPGVTSQSVTAFTVVNDTGAEGNETIIFTLSNPVNAGLDANTTFTYTIIDNDGAGTVSINATDPNAAEQGAGTGTFRISRTGSTVSPLIVNYQVTGSASSPSDYASIGTSVTIPAGSTFVDLVVTPVDDTTVEAPETVIVKLLSAVGATIGTSTATVTIADNDQAAPSSVVTWNPPGDIIYGTALGASQLTATASVPGVFTYLPPAGTVLNVGNNQELTVVFVPTDLLSNPITTNKVTISVQKATLTVTANPVSRAYGTANPTLTATITGFVNGQTLATSGVTGSPLLTCSATAASSVAGSPYPIVPSLGTLASANYDFNFVNGALTVSKVLLTVTAGPATRTYGGTNPVFSHTITGFVNGETLGTSGVSGAPSFTTSASPTSGIGSNYQVNPNFGTLAAGNYSFMFAPGQLTITPAVLTVTSVASRPFGAANPPLTPTYIGFVNGETLATSGVTGAPLLSTASTPADTVTGGPYPITVQLGTLAAVNYTFQAMTGALTVTPAVLLVTADDKTRLFGQVNPAFTGSIVGLQQGDVIVPLFASATTTNSLPGTYQITISLPDPNNKLGNYQVTATAGTLTVNKGTVTITANPATRPFGTSNPALTFTAAGFANNESFATSGILGLPALSTTANINSPVGAYPIVAALGTLASSKYDFAFVDALLTVTPAVKPVLTVTANNLTRAYGAANPALTFSITGFVDGDTLATSGVTGGPSLATAATPFSSVAGGPYPITVGIGTLASSKYDFAFVNGALNVTKAPLTVTADNQSRLYGAANPTLTSTITGFVNGETLPTSGVTGAAALSTTATATSSVPGGPYPITAAIGSLAAANYSFNFATGSLTVMKATLTVTANNSTRAYGAANPAFSAQITGFLNGETQVTAGVTGAPGFTTTANATSSVAGAPYAISPTVNTLLSANYTFSFVNGALNITPAPVTVTANNVSRPYGAANPTLDVTYSGFANGETFATSGATGAPSVTTAATPTSGVAGSPYPIVAAAGTLAAVNYAFTFVNGALTVSKASLTVTANSVTRAYGSANPALTAAITGFVNGEILATSGVTGAAAVTTTATPASSVAGGPYPVTASAGTLASANYGFNFANGTLTVTPVALTVKANDVSRGYGAANPVFTSAITGFVNGETAATGGVTGSPAFATAAVPGSPVAGSPYLLTPSLGTLAAANYTFNFATGNVTVTPAVLTVKANDATRPYGSANPVFSTVITGFVNGEVLATSGVTGAASVTSAATPSSGVSGSPYNIVAAQGTLAAPNYSFAFANGALTVTKAPLTVTAASFARAYGSANPALTANIAGFVNSETLGTSGVTGTANVTTTATPASGVAGSPYPVTVTAGTLASANYSFSFFNGTATISKAPLTVTADSFSRAYGTANPAFTAQFSGFVNGEVLGTSGVTGSPSLTTVATPGSTVAGSPYTITAALGTLASANYAFNFANGQLSLTRPVLLVKANDATRAYGAANPAFTFQVTGFVNGETLGTSGVTGTPGLSTAANAASSVAGGPYAITAALGTLASANYDFNFGSGQLAVTKAPLTVTADNQTRTYGAANPALTATITGFVNGEVLGTSGVTGTAAVTTAATPASGVAGSPYAITAANGTLAAGNYSFNFASGALTVTKATLTVTANSVSRVFGAPNPVFTAQFAGFANGETLGTSGVTGSPSLTTAANAASTVAGGPYAITAAAGTLASANYNFNFVGGLLTVQKGGTTGIVVSSSNPALPGQTVTYTAVFAAASPGSGTPTGSALFRFDGGAGSSVPLTVGGAAFSSSSLALGSHSLVVEYGGDANFLAANANLTANQVVNTPPVANADSAERFATNDVKISVASLLGNDSDGDGDALVIVSAGPLSTQGGGITISNGWVYYSRPAGFMGADSFNYTINDGRGGTASAAVGIAIKVDLAPAQNAVAADQGNGSVLVKFNGIPGRTYQIQFAESATPTTWVSLGLPQLADPVGVFMVTDTPPNGTPPRAYRAVAP